MKDESGHAPQSHIDGYESDELRHLGVQGDRPHASISPLSWDILEPQVNALLNARVESVADFEQWLVRESELDETVEENTAWLYVEMTRNTTNQDAAEAYDKFYTDTYPQLVEAQHRMHLRLLEHEARHPLPPLFATHLRGVRTAVELHRPENVPLETELRMAEREFGRIAGALTVDIEGERMPIARAANLLEETDRERRRLVYERIALARLQVARPLDDLFDNLLSLRHRLALQAGLPDYRAYAFKALGRHDYTPADCLAFHESIARHVTPLLTRLNERRRTRLGLAEGDLRPWDMAVDEMGRQPLRPFTTGAQLLDAAKDVFGELREYYRDCLENMEARGHFDLESRENKAPGGYNTGLPRTGAPFIFMNATGTSDDVTTMMHEGGHAVHSFLTQGLPLNFWRNTPIEMAEVASTAMEYFSMTHWGRIYTDPDELAVAVEAQLLKGLEILPWVALVDAFQHWLYTHPGHTSQQRNEQWTTLYKKLMPGGVNWDGLEGYQGMVWQKQLHLFEVPFYYIEYAICQLAAFALYSNFQENHEPTLDAYDRALAAGSSRTLPELYQMAGIRFDFSSEYVERVVAFVARKLGVDAVEAQSVE